MIEFVVKGMTVGVSAGGMPGPLQGYLMNTALKYGWRRGLLVLIAPLIVDIPVIIAVLVALDALAGVVPVVVDVIRVVGGAFVLYLAWGAFQDYRSGVDFAAVKTDEQAAGETPRGTFTRGLMMNVLSPGPYLFWTTVNGPTLLAALEQSIWHGAAFLVAFYGSFLGFYLLLDLGVDRLRTMDTRFTRGLLLVITVLLVVFGANLLREGIAGLVG